MTPQTITESTAHELISEIQDLKVFLAVTTEKLQNQARWNDEQEKINITFAEKLAAIDKGDVSINERIKNLEAWKNWVSGVLTAVLIAVLLTVVGGSLYFAYGVPHP